jgi:two-component system, cell cycle sensor histidine kinase and response regulator CckA
LSGYHLIIPDAAKMMQTMIQVLLVEDNPGDVLLIREILSEITTAEFELMDVGRLSDALAQLQTRVFDVVLLDLLLPDSQGLETFLQLHQQIAHIPIVVLTGLNDATLAIQAVQAGAQDYLLIY